MGKQSLAERIAQSMHDRHTAGKTGTTGHCKELQRAESRSK